MYVPLTQSIYAIAKCDVHLEKTESHGLTCKPCYRCLESMHHKHLNSKMQNVKNVKSGTYSSKSINRVFKDHDSKKGKLYTNIHNAKPEMKK